MPALEYGSLPDASVPKSRMWGPQVRFCERCPRETGGAYSTDEFHARSLPSERRAFSDYLAVTVVSVPSYFTVWSAVVVTSMPAP